MRAFETLFHPVMALAQDLKNQRKGTSELRMDDLQYLRRSLELAEKGAGLTSPGAMAGAVVVKDGKILGEGFYTWDGVRHAEVIALEQAGAEARGAAIYTSLEPCSHHGRTPPCCQRVIEAGIVRVVTAMPDPNPAVNGRGIAALLAAGVQVDCGALETDARRLNEAFITYKTQRRPFGVLKIAMTLDGKIATRTGESQWITSEESRRLVHRLRHRSDAIITGSGTILKDKPLLTDRSGLPRRRPLLRVVLDRRGRLQAHPDTFVFKGTLNELTSDLYNREIQSFLLECGPDLAFNALRDGIIDKIVVIIAPKILGGREIPAIGGDGVEDLAKAIRLSEWQTQTAGPDVVLISYVHRDY